MDKFIARQLTFIVAILKLNIFAGACVAGVAILDEVGAGIFMGALIGFCTNLAIRGYVEYQMPTND